MFRSILLTTLILFTPFTVFNFAWPLSFEPLKISPEKWNEYQGPSFISLNPIYHSEDIVLDFLAKNNIVRYSLADPNNIEGIKNNLKKWNPDIKNWHEIDRKIVIKRKTPIFHVSQGVVNRYTREGILSDSKVSTQNFGYKILFDGSYLLNANWTFLGHLNFLQLMNLYVDNSNKTYSFPIQVSGELGLSYSNLTWSWYPYFMLEYEQFGNFSINPDIITSATSQNFDVNNLLEIHTGSAWWLRAGLAHRRSFLNKGLYLQGSLGVSLFGDKAIGDETLGKDFMGVKSKGRGRLYIYKNFWIESSGELVVFFSDKTFFQIQGGGYAGYTW